MRLMIPLIPFAIQIEGRPLGPFRPRLTVYGSMIIIAIIAVAAWWYVTQVSRPAARQRWQRADSVFHLQIAILERTYQQQFEQVAKTKAAAQRCAELYEQEQREAERSPEGSEERATHRDFAERWDKSRNDYIRNFDFPTRRARVLKERIDDLRERRRLAEGNI